MNNFSVIIPLFNKESYIEKAINSVLNQRFNNYEIIVVDDGSTDNSLELVKMIKNSKLKVFHQTNQGVSQARNNGVSYSKNELVAFLDADDIWDENFLLEIDYLVKKYPSAAIYASNNFFELRNGKKIYEKYENLFDGKEDGIIDDFFKIFAETGKSPFSNSNFVIRRDIFTLLGGYKPGVKLTEDSDLWSRVAIKYDIAYTKKPLATYLINTTGNTHLIFEPCDFQVTVTLTDMLNEENIDKKFKKSIKRLIAFQKLNLIKRAIFSQNKKFAFHRLIYTNVIKHYPITVIKCFISILIPHNILIYFIKK